MRVSGLLLSLGLVLQSLGAWADGTDPDFTRYLSELRQEAKDKGIDEATLANSFRDIRFLKRSVKKDKNQPIFKQTLEGYLGRALPQWKVERAASEYRQHQPLLEKIGKDYGVQPRFIVALWGVESNFGRITGNTPILSGLATMAYEGRREAFFKKQFFAALTILQQGHIAVEDFRGSWAGAMGQTQFMPTSFLAYAVDYDGDGKKDIWQTPADVFASIANYLVQVGWNDDMTWGRQVVLTQPLAEELTGLSKARMQPLAAWQALGVRRYQGADLPDRVLPASLIMPDGPKGRVYLVYENFHSLMRWNRSTYFGVLVGLLSDRLSLTLRK